MKKSIPHRRGNVASFIFGLILLFIGSILYAGQYFQTDFVVKQRFFIPLERVANASDIGMANDNLAEALKYLQSNKLTSGNTSYFVKTARENDLTYFNKNLNSAKSELEKGIANKKMTQLEESNLLMRVREVITNENGTITAPANLGFYPKLMPNLFLRIFAIVVGSIGVLFIMVHPH